MQFHSKELVDKLNKYGVRVYIAGGKVKVKMPFPPNEAPHELIPYLKQLKENKEEVFKYLQWKTKPEVPGVEVYQLPGICCYPCFLCNYFPVKDTGWCKERIKMFH